MKNSRLCARLSKAQALLDTVCAQAKEPGFKGFSQESITMILDMQKRIREMRDTWIRGAVKRKTMSLKQIGALFGLTAARISQICSQ